MSARPETGTRHQQNPVATLQTPLADAPSGDPFEQHADVVGGLHGQRRHAPVEGHLPQRGLVVGEADGGHGAPSLGAGDRREAGPAGDGKELGVEFARDPAGPVDHGLRDRVQALHQKLGGGEKLLHGHAGGALFSEEAALHVAPAIGEILLLRLAGNPPHHLDDESWVLADGGLAGEHAGVGAVKDRIGHVGRLGPRRPPGVLHAVEHLRGHDHRLLIPLAGADDLLLHHRHARHVGLHAEVAAGHHHGVGRFDDRLEVLDRLPLLDLGHDAGDGAAGPQQFLKKLDFDGASHERQAHEVDADRRGPLRMLPVGGAHGRYRELHAGQVHSLTAADRAPLDDPTEGVGRVPLLNDEADRAIRDHDRVADAEFVDQRLVGGGKLARAIGLGAPHKPDAIPLGHIDRTTRQLAEPDLRPGKVGEHADGAGERLGDASDPVERLLVLRNRTVGHIEPEYVDAGLDEAADGLFGPRRGTEGGDDLGANNLRGRAGGWHETSWRGWD